MTAVRQGEGAVATQELGGLVAGLPRRQVIGHRADDEVVAGDLAKVDVGAQRLELARLDQQVLLEDSQEVLVELRRQVGVVLVPGEDVEGRGGIAHQVVVDPVVPHEVVRPQPGEHLVQVVAAEHAFHLGLGLGDAEHRRQAEGADRGIDLPVEHGHAERQRVDRVLALVCQIGRDDRREDAARAEGDQVDLGRAGDRGDGLDGFERGLDVVLQPPVAVLGLRVAP